jgi:hypothetical protein
MSDPFASSRRKIAWAKKNFAQLDVMVGEFVQQEGMYALFAEPDPHNSQHAVHKMRLIKQIPDGLSELAGNIVDDLRAALDHALFGVARIGKPATAAHLLNAYFPFAGDPAQFENNMKGRCKDVPKELYPLLRSYQPYKGGSELLFALNEVCCANKHGILLPVGTATITTETSIEGEGFWSMPAYPAWDSAKQEMELFTAGPQPKLKAKIGIAFYVAFGEVESAAGKNALETIDLFVNMVETMVNEIERESRRLGIVR